MKDQNKNKPRIILFCCVGNTCRSPMAAAIAQEILGDKYICKSAGSNVVESDLNQKAFIALENLKCGKIVTDKTAKISQEMIDEADMIFCLGTNVFEDINKKFPSSENKIFKYAPNRYRVPDPLDSQGFNYEETQELLKITNCKDKYETRGLQLTYDFVAKMMRDVFMPEVKKKIDEHLKTRNKSKVTLVTNLSGNNRINANSKL